MTNENKTKPNEITVQQYLDTLDNKRLNEARILIDMMQRVSDKKPVMWGTSMVGFGSYHYKSSSGREGDWLKIGFGARKAKLSLYITGDASKYSDQLQNMGKHTTGKGCIYVNKLSDIDTDMLEQIIRAAWDDPSYF